MFRARAANHDGTWSEAALAVPVRVEPWVWETTWFRALAIALAVGLVALAYRARVARLLAVERLRLRIAGDLHDDLSSDLSGIALATDLLGRRPGLEAADRQRLADVHRTATSMVDALRDIVWTVDPAHDSVEAFARRVRLVADRLLDGVTSQQKSFGLPPIMSESVETFLRKNITYIEWVKLGWYKIVASHPTKDVDVGWRKDSNKKKNKAQTTSDDKPTKKELKTARRMSAQPEELD